MIFTKKVSLMLILILITCCISAQVSAANTDHVFDEVYGTMGLGNAMTPARYPNLTNKYIRVTSKCNMARYDGTSPHTGVDMTMAAGDIVYPIFAGRITSINYNLSQQEGYVIVNSDVNQDGVPDNIFIKYLHIAPYSSSYISADINNPLSWVTINTAIATIDIQRVYEPHLHFQWLDSDNHVQKMGKFYTTIGPYYYGADFDLFSKGNWQNDVFYLTGYAKDGDTRAQLTSVNIYYQINNSAWSSTPVSMTLYNSTNFVYRYDFSNLSGFDSGDYVRFYVVGYRNIAGDNWSLWPQYYRHPSVTPSQLSAFPPLGIISYYHMHS